MERLLYCPALLLGSPAPLLGCPALLWAPLGYGTGMVRMRENNAHCIWECGQGMAQVWHGIGKVWHGITNTQPLAMHEKSFLLLLADSLKSICQRLEHTRCIPAHFSNA